MRGTDWQQHNTKTENRPPDHAAVTPIHFALVLWFLFLSAFTPYSSTPTNGDTGPRRTDRRWCPDITCVHQRQPLHDVIDWQAPFERIQSVRSICGGYFDFLLFFLFNFVLTVQKSTTKLKGKSLAMYWR
jgi:hypothetical protein